MREGRDERWRVSVTNERVKEGRSKARRRVRGEVRREGTTDKRPKRNKKERREMEQTKLRSRKAEVHEDAR